MDWWRKEVASQLFERQVIYTKLLASMIELETSPWRGKAQHKVDSEGLSAEEKYYPVVSKGKKRVLVRQVKNLIID